MKLLITLTLLAFYCIELNSQNSNYENKLAQYMAEFKSNAYSDNLRMELFKKTESLKNQIDIQLNLNNSYNDEYKTLSSTQKKIKAFYNYLSCFSKYPNTEFPKEEFDYINEVLNIYPRELSGLTCNFAICYEITIGKFKAMLVYNKLKPTDNWDYKMIEVQYDFLYNGQPIKGSKFNLAGNNIQVMEYLSDKGNPNYKVVNVRCEETK